MPIVTMKLGDSAPDFNLENIDTSLVNCADFKGQPLLVMFICNHCPFVQHIRSALAAFARDFAPQGLKIVGINSNDIEAHPEDGPENMIKEARAFDYCFPYLFDANQNVAKSYGAMCTPDFFLFDKDHALAYHGQFDNSRPTNEISPDGASLREAWTQLLEAGAVTTEQSMSIGCGIKWIPGNEPWK